MELDFVNFKFLPIHPPPLPSRQHQATFSDIGAQRLFQADYEQLDMLSFYEAWVPARESHEAIAIIIREPACRSCVSYPVFMQKLSTHRMHDPGSIVPHIRPKVHTDNQMSEYRV
jgi:hypothetical protein